MLRTIKAHGVMCRLVESCFRDYIVYVYAETVRG